LERLRRRREWLSGPQARLTPAESSRFNEYRERGLEEYRERLVALNKAILDYNLTAPTPLHRRGVIIDQAVAQAAADILPLEATVAADPPSTVSWRDRLRKRLLGALVERAPRLAKDMDAWAKSDELWLVRTAILHQNRYKARTDATRLFAYCAHNAANKDFFMRKAIGWALRTYAATDAQAVKAFVESHALAPLGVKEAMRGVCRA